ncbi:MAG TPA: hypothetical protein ENN45_02680 [Bacteroidetes bacterium]|nr:hypothetical protein [Bacteroidota bacterium]
MRNGNEVIYAPIIIQKLFSPAQKFKNFRIQIRKKGTTEILIDSVIGGKKYRNGSWYSVPFLFDSAIKDQVYQFRVKVEVEGGESAWSRWYNKIAGDNTFGATTWNNSIIATDHSLIVTIELQTVPDDFDFIEIYERDNDSVVGSDSWEFDARYFKASFVHMWTGSRNDTKYFFARAYDKSGNPSELSTPVGGNINIILPGDMDTTPPDNTMVLLIMPGEI